MTAAFHLGEWADLNCQVLQLPYAGQHQDMYIFLPKTMDGLPQLEAKLFDRETCSQWYTGLSKMPVKLVNVTIPVFRIETFKSMKSTLSQMDLEGPDFDFHVLVEFSDAAQTQFVSVRFNG